MKIAIHSKWIGLVLLFGACSAFAQDAELEACYLKALRDGDESLTIAEVKAICLAQTEVADRPEQEQAKLNRVLENPGVISERFMREHRSKFNPSVITPHRMNYVMPVLTTNSLHLDPYEDFEGIPEGFSNVEAKFQLSLKVPLNQEDVLFTGDSVYFAFTVEAWWQLYSQDISKPFRETNYRPEIFYLTPVSWHPFGGNTAFMVGIEHQSNGQAAILSRSWNRVYAQFLYEKGNFALAFKPWYRLSEDADQFPGDPNGDDNPDIADFMGHFELYAGYKFNDYEATIMTRRNFNTANGAFELGFTFPLWGRLRGYTTFFNGYGESLIDYNHKQTRFGLGIALTDVF